MVTVAYHQKRAATALAYDLVSDPHAPLSAMIEIADRCNEVCVHCFQVQGKKGEMTTEELMRVLDELADMGVLFLTLTGGEPTLRSDFLEIVRHARERKFAVKIFSNLLTMTPELARELSELAVQEVQTSVYSPRADVHDWVTKVRGSWEKTVQGVRDLRAVRIPVVIKTTMMSFNAQDTEAYIALAESLDADYIVSPRLFGREDGDRTPEAFRPHSGDYLRVRELLSADRETRPKASATARPCGACSGNVHIEANGEMRPCALLQVPVGQARDGSVREDWYHHPEALFIRGLTWADLHGCRDCDIRSHCERCFSDAQKEAGDAMGPYLDACKRARLNYQQSVASPIRISPTSDAERDAALGPYREVSPGVLEAIPDVVTHEDRARALAHPWIGRGEPRELAPHPLLDGGFVQIRRPGRRPKHEQIPGRLTLDAASCMGEHPADASNVR